MTDEIRKLERLGAEMTAHRQAIADIYGDIVKLVRSASAKGSSRREVARAAGLTAGRVQQILDGKFLAERWTSTGRRKATKPAEGG